MCIRDRLGTCGKVDVVFMGLIPSLTAKTHSNTTLLSDFDVIGRHGYDLGMYLRKTTRRNRDGSTVSYLQLALSEWDSDKARSVARIVYNFGRADQLDSSVSQGV